MERSSKNTRNTLALVYRPVSTTSVEKSILCLFYCFFFALASILTARFNRRSIKETKNALFHARSGNGPYNVTSAQYLAKKLVSLLSLLRRDSIELKYIFAKRLTFKLFNFIDLRVTHQIISAIIIAIF